MLRKSLNCVLRRKFESGLLSTHKITHSHTKQVVHSYAHSNYSIANSCSKPFRQWQVQFIQSLFYFYLLFLCVCLNQIRIAGWIFAWLWRNPLESTVIFKNKFSPTVLLCDTVCEYKSIQNSCKKCIFDDTVKYVFCTFSYRKNHLHECSLTPRVHWKRQCRHRLWRGQFPPSHCHLEI